MDRVGRGAAAVTIALAAVLGGVAVVDAVADGDAKPGQSADDKPSTSAGVSSATPSTRPSAGAASPRLVDDAVWVERDGERALRITPSDALRRSSDPRMHEDAWQRVVRAVPEADTPGVHEQFLCHAAFAPSKEGWFLEPRRPDVGYWETVAAGCNPGDVTDVG